MIPQGVVMTPKELVSRLNSLANKYSHDRMDVCINNGPPSCNMTMDVEYDGGKEEWLVPGDDETVSLVVRELVALGFSNPNLHWGFQKDHLEVSKVFYAC